jgi:hypothetical protein
LARVRAAAMIGHEFEISDAPGGALRGGKTMIRRYKLSRSALPLALVLGLALAAPALADSVATEQAQGAQVLSQVQHGTLSPKSLTSEQYQTLGEFLMSRALGSTLLHQRMNTLMDEMMGPRAADQMHVYLGKRYLGVSVNPSGRYSELWGLMGVMMSGDRGSALAGMMGAYLNGHGTAGYAMGRGMMGYGYTTTASSGGGWPAGAVVAVIALGAALIVGLGALALPRVRKRWHSGTAATT